MRSNSSKSLHGEQLSLAVVEAYVADHHNKRMSDSGRFHWLSRKVSARMVGTWLIAFLQRGIHVSHHKTHALFKLRVTRDLGP